MKPDCEPTASGRPRFSRAPKTGPPRENTLPLEEESRTLRFHYDRSERERMAGSSVNGPDRRPWHRRNRGLLILLVDIALIVVIFIIYQVFLRPNTSFTEYEQHQYELRAVEFDGEILVTLRVTANEVLVPGTAGLITSRVFLEDMPDTILEQTELLTEDPDIVRIMRFRIDIPDFDRQSPPVIVLQADVRPGDEGEETDFTLSTVLELE